MTTPAPDVRGDLFAPRWKTYASWPAVIMCRMRGHRVDMKLPATFSAGLVERCYGCGDALAERYPTGGVNKQTCKHRWIESGKGRWCPICGTGM